MSHFTVLVITSDGDYAKALAPFDENIVVEPYIRKTKEDCINEILEYKDKYDNNDEHFNRTWFEEKWGSINFEDHEEIFKKYKEYHDYDDWDGDNIISTYNPKSKWDWYSLGGRWKGTLKLKEGAKVIKESETSWTNLTEEVEEGYTDFAQVKDVDFTPNLKNVEHYKRFWEINVENSPLQENEKEEDFRSFYNARYYKDTYGTVENYIDDMCNLKTYAILNHGEWIEPGAMGWWGINTSTKDSNAVYRQVYKDIIKNLNPEDYLAVVDCHI